MKRILKKLRHYYSVLGLCGVAAFLLAKLSGTKPLLKVCLSGIRHPVYIRIGTTDLSVLKQTLVEKHYDFSIPIRPKFIIDAGANIGLSAVFFANKYPDALIVAIEPDDSNFALLERNTTSYPKIKPLKAALWSENREISLFDPGCGAHGFRATEESNGERNILRGRVKGITIDSLIDQMSVNAVDLLKVDIEGSEKEVFENSSKWIGRSRVIMVELHDDYKPGSRQAFLAATNEFGNCISKGETIMRIQNRLLANAACC